MKNIELLNTFLNYLKLEKNYSELTLDKYKKNLLLFFKYVDKSIENIIEQDIRDFIYALYTKEYKKSTISNFISTIKSFFKYLYKREYISQNISIEIEYPKKEKRLPKIIYEKEFNTLLNVLVEGNKYSYRNKALLYLLYTTGIRVSECSNLKIKDIDFEKETILITGKGNKERIVPTTKKTLQLMLEYINLERNNLNKNEIEYLFINNKATQLTSRGIRTIIDNLCERSDVNLDMSPHIFRHTLATNLLSNGMDLRYVQKILGHSNLTSTQVYTNLTSKEIRKKYDRKMKR